MARFEMSAPSMASLAGSGGSADFFYRLGIDHAVGRGVPLDLVEAHKWFNIAAVKGSADGARMRGELASEMTAAQIAEAQREARAFLSLH